MDVSAWHTGQRPQTWFWNKWIAYFPWANLCRKPWDLEVTCGRKHHNQYLWYVYLGTIGRNSQENCDHRLYDANLTVNQAGQEIEKIDPVSAANALIHVLLLQMWLECVKLWTKWPASPLRAAKKCPRGPLIWWTSLGSWCPSHCGERKWV